MDDIKNETISELREKDREHDARLDSLSTQNQNQEFKLKTQAAKGKERDFRLDSLVCKNGVQDEEIHRQAIKDNEHDLRIDALENRIEILEKQIRNMMKLQVENAVAEYTLESEKKNDRTGKAVQFMSIFSFVGMIVFFILLLAIAIFG